MSTYSGISSPATLAADTQGLEQLKSQAKHAPDKAIAGAAKQFEAMFLGMIMKSMREATPKDGMFDSEQTKMFTGMLDQQFAQTMAARGTGLAETITRQLSRGGTMPDAAGAATSATSAAAGIDKSSALQMSTLALARLNLESSAAAVAPSSPAAPNFDVQPLSLDDEAWSDGDLLMSKHMQMPARMPVVTQMAAPAAGNSAAGATGANAVNAAGGGASLAQTGGFVNRIWNHAVEAARTLGVRPQFMVGQAALESGWGKHEIRNADGSGTHNLFGVKAGKGWTGPTVDKTTTEYVNGVPQKMTEKFRVYSSYGEAFKDYAKLIGGNPRYAGVLAQAQDARGFARGLQQAGYATDPAYADKLVRVINGTTLRQSLAYAPPVQDLPQMLARR